MPAATADRPSKRARTIEKPTPSQKKPIKQPRLFAPFRALGYISNHIPFALQLRSAKGALDGPNLGIISCLGKSWAMWDGGKMGLLFVGPEAESPIAGLAVHGNDIFASAGGRVLRYLRGKQVGSYEASSPDVVLGQILLFGEQLLALAEDGSSLTTWNITSGEIEGEINFKTGFTATTMLHPATYLNKILVGSREGELQLWNIRTISLIHTFPSITSSPSPITTLTQSPAIDVIGVGYQDGTIRITDIRLGEEVMGLKMSEGAVARLAFRMDGPPILASSSSDGSIAIWDLQTKGKLLHTLRDAHEASVTGLEWVQGQPLLISSSGDNSIKQWVFDADTALPRLLKGRTGHHAPISCLRYYGEDGKQMLTAGRDRALRYTSVVRDTRSHELSQGSLVKKANNLSVKVATLKHQPALAIASSSTRSKDWEDVVTAHLDDASARTWRVQDKKAGRWAFDVEDGVVKAVCVTACGNYGIAGSSTGQIRMFNMQSGQQRRTFALPGVPQPTKATKKNASKRNRSIKSVTGIVTDGLNKTLIASTLDGTLHHFDFHTSTLEYTTTMPSSITSLSLQRDSGLLAVVCDDHIVRLIDIETKKTVRELGGFKGRILDATFSSDSRWLIATALDSVIRTFDVPTGQLVDAFRTSSVATSLTFSPTGDFLASAHGDSVGVYLWANKAQFMEVSLRRIDDDDVYDAALPSVQGMDSSEGIDGIEPVGEPSHQDIYTSPEQLTEGLLTLSLMPRSRWQTLLNLDIIRARNKPKEAPKAPEKAPFFLPTVSGLETRFDLSDQNKTLEPLESSSKNDLFVESDFTRRLTKEDPDGDFSSFFEYAKGLSPSALDLEIRSLLSLDHLNLFLRALIGRLRSHRDFEAVQAFLSVCLTVHGDILVANEELQETLEELAAEQKKESGRLLDLISFSLGTLSFVRS